MRSILAFGLAVCLASSAGAAVKIGYGTIPGSNLYPQFNVTTSKQANKTESFSFGMLTFGGDSLTKINDNISIGIEVGAGMPMGSYKFDETNYAINVPAGADKNQTNAGDTFELNAATATVLAKGVYSMPLGNGIGSLGLGLGTTMVGLLYESINQKYDNATGQTAEDKVTETGCKFVPLFVIGITPGYAMTVGTDLQLGLEIPLSIMSTADVENTETNMNPVNPNVENPQTRGFEIGGFGWGVNITLTKKI